MKSSDWVLAVPVTLSILTLLPCLVHTTSPTRTLRIVEDDSDYTESLVPSAKVNSRERFHFGNRVFVETPVRRDIGQSQEDTKTESPSYNYEDVELSDSEEAGGAATEKYSESSTNRIPSIPAALRRSFALTTPEPSASSGVVTVVSPPKPKKAKTRRRKVKRPSKLKGTTPKAAPIDDLGIPENSNKGNSTGEKNLALEIGSDDGKYALINQFFEQNNDTKPPGIVSYAQSQDFPHDNQQTLGNVQQNDIWLSEGDLLVLKGGHYDSDNKEKWKPIDSYERKKPLLKIPLDTNNPPPFPVFVNKTGPPVFLGPPPPFGLPYPPPGSNETFDPSRFPPPGLIPLFPHPPGSFGGNNDSFPPFPFPPPRPGPLGPGKPGGVYGGVNGPPGGGGGLYGAGPPGAGYGYGGLNDGYPPPAGLNGSYPPLPPFPFPPPNYGNGSGGPPPPFFPFGPPPPGFNQNFSGGPGGPGGPGPGFPFLPPLVLNPADNETDDPSIFLPPPYDFDYHEDNSTIVPPGPFAPGLVVPPPQDFYIVFNRTSPAPRPTPISSYFDTIGKRPQRPNAKKPKFPITNPPDDSLEADLPQSSPLPVIPINFPTKKRKRPGKVKSYQITNLKYGKEKDSSEEYSGETPVFPDSIPLTPRQSPPVLLIPRPLLARTTATPTTTTPTPTTTTTEPTTTQPTINYVYVRGKLKTLAEIAAEQAIEDGFDPYSQSQTPRPPFDELGYPTRVGITENQNQNQEPIIYAQRLPTREPQKLYYSVTPSYNLNYNPNAPTYQKKKSKVTTLHPTSYTFSKNQDETVPRYYQPTPTITQIQQQEDIRNYNQNSDGVITQQFPNTNYRKPIKQQQQQAIEPNYPPTEDDNAQPPVSQPLIPQRQTPTQITIYQPQQQYVINNNNRQPAQQLQPQRQPLSFSHNSNNPNTGFRPAFPPPQQQQQQPQRVRNSGGRVLFPGQISSRNPNIYNQNTGVIYQQPQQQQQQQPQQQQPLQGYYSPISQYHQPVDGNGQFIPNTFFPSQLFPSTRPTQYFSQPYFQQFQQQQQQQQQQPQYSPFIQQQPQQQQRQQQALPLHSDILVNYREPLPQYNTESESITRTQTTLGLKAGPRLPFIGTDPTGAGSSAAASSPVQQAGSFYSFQRGGPGGFSYKIRL